ncbi:sigma-70 family RNA polymerase sigma factor [Sphingomonas sp. 1P06PA]|uniref:sigma-70 family RNA polymerase sigma factor n=1 Tax=Sphingomonas sp. 1P06PA TaxID=554121 RepID=UPI0039A66B2E
MPAADPEPPLEALLVAVAAEDRAAFAELYRRTAAKLNGIVRRILPEGGLADEAMQDAYVRVWRSAAGYDARRGRPITWLAAIARNIAIDVRRREVARGSLRNEELQPDVMAADPGTPLETSVALERCLDGLDREHRDMIVGAYCHGLSREELAERHGRPVGTVKSWLHRGLAGLKACLEG